MVGTSDQSCWLAEACKFLLLPLLGEAYSECLKADHMVQLIRLEAFGKVKSGGKLEQQLQAMTKEVAVPEMPKTKAVLESIAASDDHPGAIYRLAGDRSGYVL